MGIIYADLALEQFSQAEANLFLLGETYPTFLHEPTVLYAQGIIALHKGDYANAERALKEVKSADAQYTWARPTCSPSARTWPPPPSRT